MAERRHIYPCRRWVDAVPSRIPEAEKRVGIDIGGVLCIHQKDMINSTNSWWLDAEMEVPHAMQGLACLVDALGRDNVFIISKAKYRMQRQLETWLFHTMDICGQTGILRENIAFCTQRNGPNGKGVQAKAFRLSHFLDDKLECLESIYGDPAGNSREHVDAREGKLVLFARSGMGRRTPSVPHRLPTHVFVAAANWHEVLNILLDTRKKVTWGTEERISEQEDRHEVIVRNYELSACSSPAQEPEEEFTGEEECHRWDIEEEYEHTGPAKQQGKWGVALADFDASKYGPEYLQLQAGEQVFISPPSPDDQQWLHVWSNRLGQYGWIPPTFVEPRD